MFNFLFNFILLKKSFSFLELISRSQLIRLYFTEMPLNQLTNHDRQHN